MGHAFCAARDGANAEYPTYGPPAAITGSPRKGISLSPGRHWTSNQKRFCSRFQVSTVKTYITKTLILVSICSNVDVACHSSV